MSLTLDHLVILVKDLPQAIRDYQGLGFQVQVGGVHADGSTHNALVVFADGTYLELIAFLKVAPHHRWFPHAAARREGFIDFALLPSDTGSTITAARAAGVDYQGPNEGGRLRPDGERLVWQIGQPPSADLPFLCGDVTPRRLRVPEGAVREHPNSAQGIASLTIAVRDLQASVAHYAALLGAQAQPAIRPVTLAGLGVRLAQITLGTASLVLVSPGPATSEPAATALRALLERQGEGLLAAALHGPVGSTLPLAHTHGARLEFQPLVVH